MQIPRWLVVVAELFLQFLATFLSVYGERGSGSCLKSAETDFFAGFFAVAVGAVVDSFQRFLDFPQQLALAIASPQLEDVVTFAACPFGFIPHIAGFGPEMFNRLLGVADELLSLAFKNLAEVGQMERAHILFTRARTIASG